MSMIAQLAVAAAVYAIDRPYSYRVPGNFPSRRHCAPVGRKHM